MPPSATEQLLQQPGRASVLPDDSARAIIIGAGPSGLATAACLRQHGVPYIIIERAHCIASLWKTNTYDRLCMHTAKNCCELPFMPLPDSYPTFLTRQQFIDYLEAYAQKFHIKPNFNETVVQASYDNQTKSWTVGTKTSASACTNEDGREMGSYIVCKQYVCKWLVAATGENAEAVPAHLPGLASFKGTVTHSSQYKNASYFERKKVLVIGAGNSGMEIALDLATSSTATSIVVRSPLHVLPREMFGLSTFSVAMKLCKIFPVRFVDCILVTYSHFKFGDTLPYGLRRPKIGPLELKNSMGKTPILDVGTLSMIQAGHINVKPAIECITASSVRFIDNSTEIYDALILATGYKSNVPTWLQDDEEGLFTEQGLCRSPSESWKGTKGLYAAGLSGMGLLRAIQDARLIGDSIMRLYNTQLVKIS